MSRDAEHSSGERGTVRGSRPTSSRRSYLKLAGASGFAGISALAGCVGGLGGGSKGPIKLGTAFPYTGPYSKEANTQKDGVNLAVDEINNDGGLMGRDLKVVDRDTELDGGTSTRRVQDLIQNEEVDLLIANLSGGISIQTNVQAKKADVPYMAGCQTVPKFHAPDNLGDGSYTPYALNVQTARADTNYIYNNIGKSVFGVVADYAWGNSSWQYAAQHFKDLGGEVKGVTKAPLGNKDFSSQMTAAKNSGADVVYLQNFGADQANSLKQAHEFGLGKEMDIYVGLTTATIAQRAGQDQWENVYAGIQYYHSADNSGTKKFSQAMQDKFDYPGDSYAAVCYTGVKEFARAIKNQQSLDVKDISSYLEKNTGFQYTKTKENWRACDNQAVQDWYIVKGKSPSNIDNEWDIFEAADNVGGRDLLLKCSEY